MVPELTYGQRMAALEKANEGRRMRQAVKRALKAGTLDPVRALSMEDVAGMRARDFLRSLPGVGAARADAAMRGLRIAGSRRVRGLGRRQMERLLDWIEQNVD